MRSTSVLTKNPIRSSSAASVRPAIGLPIAMSVPAPSRVSSPASRRLQHHEQARAGLPRQHRQTTVQLGADLQRHMRRRDGSTPRAAAGRPAARSDPAGPSARRVQNESCRAIALEAVVLRPAPPAATACSRRTAPAAAQAPPPGPHGAPGTAPPGPATADPATSRRRRCDAAADSRTCSSCCARARTDAPAAAARSTDRSPARPLPPAPPARSASVTASTSSRSRAAAASRIYCRGTPSRSGNTVRRLSWRSTRSPSAASSAARSSAPDSRTASGIT